MLRNLHNFNIYSPSEGFQEQKQTTGRLKLRRFTYIGGRTCTFRKPPYFVPSKPQTAFVFF